MTKPLGEREFVLGILMDITENDIYSHIALGNVLGKYQYLDKKERAFITRVTEGTLEHMIEIDYILDQFSKVKVRKMKPVIRNILRSAVYQLKYMDSVPNSAVCNEAVKLAVKKGFGTLKGFVNGVLRNVARKMDEVPYPAEPVKAMSVRYSMPEWILKKWLGQYDAETVGKMLADFQMEKPVSIRCNLSRISAEDLERQLQSEGVTVKKHPYLPYAFRISGYDYLGELASFAKGLFTIQDISSMLVCEAAGPKEGDYVIDVCAAPGGKAIHAADRLNGSGQVEARDLTERKISFIRENIDRVKLGQISAVVKDALEPDEASAGKADIVIADLPCSGLGVLGRKTDLKYKVSETQTEELAVLQRKILENVCLFVKPGGMLVYSTCTINRAENQENAKWFLEHHPDFCCVSMKDNLCEELKDSVDEDGFLQLLPGIHDSDGFFIARFKKKGSV